jgi:threonine synthase
MSNAFLSPQVCATGETPAYSVSCEKCHRVFDPDTYRPVCPECGGALCLSYPDSEFTRSKTPGSMWKYVGQLPVRDSSKIVTLGEGNTPLIRARADHGVDVYYKNETVNPTGSHKDRALSIAITKAVEFGFNTCMLYSDGSAALSSAAYAARAGMHNIALVPQGAPDYRLLPLQVYNSTILEYAGSAADALDWVHSACQELDLYETTTYRRANPYQSEGPKTIAYEIVDQLGGVPDWVLIPVGGGGTLSGIWRGFCELRDYGGIARLPRLAGVLPEHYTLLQQGLDDGLSSDLELRTLSVATRSAPQTAQAKLAMAFPPDGIEAIAAVRDSDGVFLNVSDREAFTAQMELGSQEGLYAEISAAVSCAALTKLRESGTIQPGANVVVLLCGSGFRETGEVALTLPVKKIQVDPHSGMQTLTRVLKGL